MRKRCKRVIDFIKEFSSKDISEKVKYQLLAITIICAVAPHVLAMISSGLSIIDFTLETFLRDGSLAVSAALLLIGTAFIPITSPNPNEKGNNWVAGVSVLVGTAYLVFAVVRYHRPDYKGWVAALAHLIFAVLCVGGAIHFSLRKSKNK